jgi:hypothetical protein
MAPLHSRRQTAQHHPASSAPKCLELNVMENAWQFMRANWPSNRIFKKYDDIVAHCCHHWNRLIDQPWRIMSIDCAIGHTGSDQRELV